MIAQAKPGIPSRHHGRGVNVEKEFVNGRKFHPWIMTHGMHLCGAGTCHVMHPSKRPGSAAYVHVKFFNFKAAMGTC